MKRNILLAMVLVMLVSISGCLIGWEDEGRGGRGGGGHGGQDRDGGHDRGGQSHGDKR